jgi:hypothetical protein
MMLTLPSWVGSEETGRPSSQNFTGETGRRCNWTVNALSHAKGVVLSRRPLSERSRVTASCALRRVRTLITGALVMCRCFAMRFPKVPVSTKLSAGAGHGTALPRGIVRAMMPGNGVTESTARLARSIGGSPFVQAMKEACNDGSKLRSKLSQRNPHSSRYQATIWDRASYMRNMTVRPVEAAKSAGTSRNDRAGTKAAKKAGGNKCQRLILSRGADPLPGSTLITCLIVKIWPISQVQSMKSGAKEIKK